MSFLSLLKPVNTFIFDMDGVLTDGSVQATESGELLRTFNIKDGYALQLAVKKGYTIVVLSGGRSKAAEKRFEGLGIKHVFMGVPDKVGKLALFLQEHSIQSGDVIYVGDDIPDLQVMQKVGLPVCPADAVDEVKSISKYISPLNGGKGCVRDIIEKTMKVQQTWTDEEGFVW